MAPATRSPPERTAYWRRPGLDAVEFFEARFWRDSYTRHSHDGYAIGVIDRGVQAFACRGEGRVARAGSVVIINPDDAHDGHAVGRDRCYRMIYVGEAVFARAVGELAGRPGRVPLFLHPIIDDRDTAGLIAAFHALGARAAGALELETALLNVLAHVVARFSTKNPPSRTPCLDAPLVRAVHRHLAQHLEQDPSLSDLSAVTGISRYHLLRCFRRAVGMPPHAYLTQLRLREARRLLAAGEPAARVAAAVGFVDQSHLIKRFRAAYGVTPAQFCKG